MARDGEGLGEQQPEQRSHKVCPRNPLLLAARWRCELQLHERWKNLTHTRTSTVVSLSSTPLLYAHNVCVLNRVANTETKRYLTTAKARGARLTLTLESMRKQESMTVTEA
jgi:hypothetical protein